jgi:hypothetical protein
LYGPYSNGYTDDEETTALKIKRKIKTKGKKKKIVGIFK